MSTNYESFTDDDLAWLRLRQQIGEYWLQDMLRAGKHPPEDETWRLGVCYLILNASPTDLARAGISPSDISSEWRAFVAVRDASGVFGSTTATEKMIFFASCSLNFDFTSATATVARDIFHHCRQLAGEAHLKDKLRFLN